MTGQTKQQNEERGRGKEGGKEVGKEHKIYIKHHKLKKYWHYCYNRKTGGEMHRKLTHLNNI